MEIDKRSLKGNKLNSLSPRPKRQFQAIQIVFTTHHFGTVTELFANASLVVPPLGDSLLEYPVLEEDTALDVGDDPDVSVFAFPGRPRHR